MGQVILQKKNGGRVLRPPFVFGSAVEPRSTRHYSGAVGRQLGIRGVSLIVLQEMIVILNLETELVLSFFLGQTK